MGRVDVSSNYWDDKQSPADFLKKLWVNRRGSAADTQSFFSPDIWVPKIDILSTARDSGRRSTCQNRGSTESTYKGWSSHHTIHRRCSLTWRSQTPTTMKDLWWKMNIYHPERSSLFFTLLKILYQPQTTTFWKWLSMKWNGGGKGGILALHITAAFEFNCNIGLRSINKVQEILNWIGSPIFWFAGRGNYGWWERCEMGHFFV